MKRERNAQIGIQMKKKDTAKRTSLLVSGMILFFLAGFMLTDKKEFSENENRYLKSLPSFSFEKLEAGVFTGEIETYLSDHFPFRDFFMNLKTSFELMTGRCEVNDIYFAEGDYLIEKYQEPVNTQKIIRTFASLSESLDHAEVTLMLVPTAITIYEDKLPDFAEETFSVKQMDTLLEIYENVGCRTVDAAGALLAQKDEDGLYYRLDHHWTSRGAYLAYREYAKTAGFEAKDEALFQKTVVTEDFKGTLYSKANDYTKKGDSITAYELPGEAYTVEYKDTKEVTDSVYASVYLEKKDKYSFFLNNIHPLIEITNENAETSEELILVKDSYANCFVPFLISHYKKIYVLDTRYYKEGVSGFANSRENVSRILILYNMNTLDSDLGIGGIY